MWPRNSSSKPSKELTEDDLRDIRRFCLILRNPGVQSAIIVCAAALSESEIVAQEVRKCIDHTLECTGTVDSGVTRPQGAVQAFASISAIVALISIPDDPENKMLDDFDLSDALTNKLEALFVDETHALAG